MEIGTPPASESPLWTQDQGVAYEAALDCIRDVASIYLGLLAEEEAKPSPDRTSVDMLKRSIEICWRWRDSLSVTDDEGVASATRDFGATAKNWQLEQSKAAPTEDEIQAAGEFLRNVAP